MDIKKMTKNDKKQKIFPNTQKSTKNAMLTNARIIDKTCVVEKKELISFVKIKDKKNNKVAINNELSLLKKYVLASI